MSHTPNAFSVDLVYDSRSQGWRSDTRGIDDNTHRNPERVGQSTNSFSVENILNDVPRVRCAPTLAAISERLQRYLIT